MAWTTIPSFSAGAVLTAAQLNTYLRANLNALLPLDGTAWTSYTPTLTQSAAVAKTVTYAKYTQLGNTVICQVFLTVTAPGTANNKVTITLPVTAANTNAQTIGSGNIVDTSSSTNNPGLATLDSTTTVALLDTTAAVGGIRQGQTGSTFAAALANTPDLVIFDLVYEV